MFHAKAKLGVIKEAVDLLSILVPEARFNADKNGISIKAVDPSRISMIALTIEKDAFEEYDASETSLGIDLEKLKDTLKLGSSDGDITMDQDEESNLFVVKLGNITRKMPLIDVSGMSDPKVPELDLPARAVVPLDDIRKGVAAAKSIGDSITLIINENGFDTASRSEGADQASMHIPKDALIELDIKEGAKSAYPLESFSKMISAIKSANITIRMGSDYPLDISFDIANGKGHAKYLLAPRVENY